jgi:hypothetical protein
MSSDKLFAWSWRLLPLLVIAGLLIPREAWIAQEIRTFAGLITVLVLPGFALARGLRLFDEFDNWLEALALSVALSWSIGLVLWLLFFFLGFSLQAISWLWIGFAFVGLIISAFIPLPNQLKSRSNNIWLGWGAITWIFLLVFIAYLYGSLMTGDAYSYMSWLRNITVGDIQPGVNIQASWETNYPFFKNLYAPTLLYYAISSFLARVDPNWIWTHAPAFWVPIMLAVQFSLAYRLFNRKIVGYATLILSPLAGGLLRLFSRLGNSHTICNVIFLPMAFWLFLVAIFARPKLRRWSSPLAVLIAVGLTFEHLPHIVHYLLVTGTFTALHLFLRNEDVFWRSTILIVTASLLSAPFLWHTWNLATAYGFDAGKATTLNLDMGRVQRPERFLLLGAENSFIVRPRRLFSPAAILGLVVVVRYIGYLWRDERRRLIIASWGIALFIALNPLLTPLLSRTIAPHAAFRLREAIIIYPILAYGVVEAISQVKRGGLCTHPMKSVTGIFLIACILLLGYRVGQTTISALNEKIKGIIYAPAEVSSNITDRLLRRTVERELESPPYPIMNPSARLTHYLNAPTLAYIRHEIPSDSVFLSERLTEYNLPAYADQLTYLGRKGWPDWGNICPRVRQEGAKAAFPDVDRPEVYERLDVTCTLLDPTVNPNIIDDVLRAHQSEIDYLLVTPNTSYLEPKLDQILSQARVYTGGSFSIYRVDFHSNGSELSD